LTSALLDLAESLGPVRAPAQYSASISNLPKVNPFHQATKKMPRCDSMIGFSFVHVDADDRGAGVGLGLPAIMDDADRQEDGCDEVAKNMLACVAWLRSLYRYMGSV
jgi:hypothetical protein